MNKTTKFIVLNGNSRGSFDSIDDFKLWAKNKLPIEGDEWEIEEVITQVNKHTIPCERKRIVNTNIIKRIIDTFIEKANIKNVSYDSDEWKMTDPQTSPRARVGVPEGAGRWSLLEAVPALVCLPAAGQGISAAIWSTSSSPPPDPTV